MATKYSLQYVLRSSTITLLDFYTNYALKNIPVIITDINHLYRDMTIGNILKYCGDVEVFKAATGGNGQRALLATGLSVERYSLTIVTPSSESPSMLMDHARGDARLMAKIEFTSPYHRFCKHFLPRRFLPRHLLPGGRGKLR